MQQAFNALQGFYAYSCVLYYRFRFALNVPFGWIAISLCLLPSIFAVIDFSGGVSLLHSA